MNKYCALGFIAFCLIARTYAQSITATYNTGDIPTSFAAYDGSCTGPSATLSIMLPAGDEYTVTGIDIHYDMAALNSGFMSHQRSYIHCQNTNQDEATVSGAGDMNGVYPYDRLDVDIANGTYVGGTQLVFEMRAWRTFEGTPGCSSVDNRVNVLTWTITVYYGDEIISPKVGVETSDPSTTLDVQGKITIGDDSNQPVPGTIRWNASTQDFEGFNGTTWMSFTQHENIWGDSRVFETSQLTTTIPTMGDGFGYGAAIQENIALIGAPQSDISPDIDQGRVFVYENAGSTWLITDTLTASDGQDGDVFGRTIAVSGDYFITGAQYRNVGGSSNQGQAYIFHWTGSAWTEQDIITGSDPHGGDQFGRVVDINGDYAIVGTYGADVGANVDQGKAYIFVRNGTDWTEQKVLIASDGVAGDTYGFSIGISGYYAIAGAPLHMVGGIANRGQAYISKRSGTQWAQQAILSDPGGEEDDGFGWDADIDGDYAIVSSIQKSINNIRSGAVFVFKRNGLLWQLQDTLIPSDGSDNDNFGSRVAIKGSYAVIAAANKTVNGNNGAGRVYVFKRAGDTWVEEAKLSPSDSQTLAVFGEGIGLDNDWILIGAPGYDVEGNEGQGKAFFFKK